MYPLSCIRVCNTELEFRSATFIYLAGYVHFMILFLILFFYFYYYMLYHLSWLSENVGNENKFYDRKIEVKIKWKCPATKDTHKDTEKSEKSASKFGVVAYLLHHHHHHLSNELPFIRCLCGWIYWSFSERIDVKQWRTSLVELEWMFTLFSIFQIISRLTPICV